MTSESSTSARQISAAQKRAKAVELRKAGLSYSRIAAHPRDPANGDRRPLYASAGAAHKAVTKALEDLRADTQETAHDVLALELSRLDEMHAGMWLEAIKGDPATVAGVLKLQERRTKYLGLDFADGLDERFIAVQEEEAARTQEAFEHALRAVGLDDDQVEEVFGLAAQHLGASPSASQSR